jgi:hypothetical protein
MCLDDLKQRAAKSGTTMKHVSLNTVKFNNNARARTYDVRVIRYDGGALKSSKPCVACIASMRRAGIRRVTWSTGNPEHPFDSELVSRIASTWVSRCRR